MIAKMKLLNNIDMIYMTSIRDKNLYRSQSKIECTEISPFMLTYESPDLCSK